MDGVEWMKQGDEVEIAWGTTPEGEKRVRFSIPVRKEVVQWGMTADEAIKVADIICGAANKKARMAQTTLVLKHPDEPERQIGISCTNKTLIKIGDDLRSMALRSKGH